MLLLFDRVFGILKQCVFVILQLPFFFILGIELVLKIRNLRNKLVFLSIDFTFQGEPLLIEFISKACVFSRQLIDFLLRLNQLDVAINWLFDLITA